MLRKLIFHRFAFLALILCPALLFSISEVEFNKPKLFSAAEYQLTPQFFRFISAGFWPAAADYLWIQTLQKIGTGDYGRDSLLESLGFYRLSTDLEPQFYPIYDQAAVVFSFYFEAVYPALELIDKGLGVYEKGNYPKKFWTHPYSLYLYRAYVNAFLKNDWSQARIDYLNAASTPGSPEYLQGMKIWLKEEGSEPKLAVKVLRVLVDSTKDPVIKKKYQEKLESYSKDRK